MAPLHANILMTGGGAPGAAGILKCLQQDPRLEITLADANPGAVGRWLHGVFETIPFAHEKEFIDQLLFICKKRNIQLIMPLVTKELIPLAQNKEQFEASGIKLLLSDLDSLEIANNKSRLYQFLEWRGITVPHYKVVETIDEFKEAVHELGFPSKPVCFKPSVSNGGRGFRILANDRDKQDLLFNEKPGNCYISYDEAVQTLSLKPFPELLITEYLPGEEFSVDCLANHGEIRLVIPRLREKITAGISVEGEFVKEENIISYCSQIATELRLHGNIGIQVKRSAEGKLLIIEINPRVQGTTVAGLGAGINLPLLAVKQELGWSITSDELIVNWGVKFARYWSEVFF